MVASYHPLPLSQTWTQLTHGPWGAWRTWGPSGSLGPVAARLSEGIRQQWISWEGKDSECVKLGEWGSRSSPATSATLALTVLQGQPAAQTGPPAHGARYRKEGRAAF